MIQRSTMAADVSGVVEWSMCMWWCEWSILRSRLRDMVGGEWEWQPFL